MTRLEFGALYERYAGDVMRFALYLTGDRVEADEIVAETFVRAWLATGEIRTDTVKDLWPVYDAGEASADTQALVDAFLASDPEFARLLRGPIALPTPPAPLHADLETRALRRTRDLVRGNAWLRGVRLLALAVTALAIVHLIGNATWSTSPRMFIVDILFAVDLWIIYAVWLGHERRKALR